jgi:hypothetical protein
METRKDRIRRLQGWIALEKAQKAIFVKHKLYSEARQALLDGLEAQLAYEEKMELEEMKNPPVVPPPKKNGHDNTGRNILIGVVTAVIAGLIIYFLITYVFS